MHRTLQDRLKDEFLRWDALGRGETTWDCPVYPEPYFIPFVGHGYFTGHQGFADEGRREGGVSGFFRRFQSPIPEDPPEDDPFASLDGGEPPDCLRDDHSLDLMEALWTVPDSVKWKIPDFEPFLYALGAAVEPICFEFVAAKGGIELQWVVDRGDTSALSEAVTQLPFSSNLEWREDHLASLLIEKQPPILWSRDLALGGHFVLPLRTQFPIDPLAEILSSLSGIGDDLIALVQVRFQPCSNPWAESMFRLTTMADGKPFGGDNRALADGAKAKCHKPLYAATIRLTVLGSVEESVDECRDRMLRPFMRFEDENGFIVASDYDRSWEDTLVEIVERRTCRSGMILNGDELLCLVHPPSAGSGVPAVARLRRKTSPAPSANSGRMDTVLGVCRHGGSQVPCGLQTSERLRHLHVLGGSGTGKSTILLNLILQDLEAGHGIALLDPHGDLVDAVLDRLPESRIGDVALFDPADEEWPVGFNILRAHNDIERNLIASDFVAIFERLSTSWGDQMTTVLGNAAMAFLASDEGGTILDLKRFLIEKGLRDRFLNSVRDPEVRYFWTHEFPLLRGSTQASLITRLNGFLRHPLVRNIVSQRGDRFDVARMMDQGKIILAKLSQGLIGEENSWLLGSLLVSKIHQAALSRQAQEQAMRRPFFLYLDEAHNFVTPSIAAILSGARKYGLGLVLAHQDLDQFPSRENGILASILSNCHSRVYFRLGDKDAKKLEDGFTHFDSDDFRRLRTGEAICRIGGSDADFSLDPLPAPPPTEGHELRRRRAIEHSRENYAAARQEVERSMQGKTSEPASESPPATRRKKIELPKLDSASPPTAPSTDFEPTPPAEVPDSIPPQIVEDSEPEPAPPPSPEPPLPHDSPKMRGLGSDRHKFLQKLIEQHGRGIGLGPDIEFKLANGLGKVDVLLFSQSLRIAFEVANKSDAQWEVHNIEKCVKAGIDAIVVVSDDLGHLNAIMTKAEQAGIEGYGEQVAYIHSSQIADYFAELGSQLASHETQSRGYKVSVKYSKVSNEEQQSKMRAINRNVAELIRKVRKQKPDPPDA